MSGGGGSQAFWCPSLPTMHHLQPHVRSHMYISFPNFFLVKWKLMNDGREPNFGFLVLFPHSPSDMPSNPPLGPFAGQKKKLLAGYFSRKTPKPGFWEMPFVANIIKIACFDKFCQKWPSGAFHPHIYKTPLRPTDRNNPTGPRGFVNVTSAP